MQTQQSPTTQPPTQKNPNRTGLLIAAAAFVLVLIVSAVALLSNGGASELPPAATTTPPTTLAADLAPEPIPTPSEAVAVANAWYAAFNAGDIDAAMALFAPDPGVSNNFTGPSNLENERENNIWNAAQGTRLETEGCVAIESTERGQNVRCVGANYDALVQALDATPVPATVTMTIGTDGIVTLRYSYGHPDFNDTGEPFDEWLALNHPDVEDFGFGSFKTVGEAEASGTLMAHYSAEWAVYLEVNGCTYLDGC